MRGSTRSKRRLKAAREREEQRNRPAAARGAMRTIACGNRVLAELIGGIGGGVLLGWVIDRFAGTSPWGLLVVTVPRDIVAFRNIIRISNRRPEGS